MANICGNYLQVITKDSLENQVGLGICMARFASHCGIIGAHPKQSRFQLPLQLGAKCLVISQLTISILGILRRHCIPLTTNPHTTTGVNSRSSNNSTHTRTGVNSSSSNNSRSNSNSSKVGCPELAQPNTNLRLTQDGRMQGTMKNLTFVARHVRCAITRKACVNGVHRFGFGVHLSHLPMYRWGPWGGGRLGPLPPGGSPPLLSGGQNHKWPTSGQGGYITPAASERGAKSEVAHKWARWLHNPCRLGGPHRFRAGGRIRSGSSQKWKILFFGGHATKRGFQSGGAISESAHKWAQWQSELIFWVSHLLSKKKFLLSNLLSKKTIFFY